MSEISKSVEDHEGKFVRIHHEIATRDVKIYEVHEDGKFPGKAMPIYCGSSLEWALEAIEKGRPKVLSLWRIDENSHSSKPELWLRWNGKRWVQGLEWNGTRWVQRR